MAQKATVFNPQTGERKVVAVGDPNAFAGGFVLETPTNRPTVNKTEGATGDLSGTLSSSQSQFDIMRELSKQIAKTSQQGAAQRGIDIAKGQGLNLFNPQSARTAIEQGALSKFDIKDIYQTTLDRISKQEENQKEGIAYITQLATEAPSFFKQLTGQELEYIKNYGVPHQSTAAKLAQYRIENPVADEEFVISLRNKYFDAGIESTDTPEEAKNKVVKNSRIYQEQVRPPVGSRPPEPDKTVSNFDNIMQQVIDAGGTPEQAAQEAAIASEGIGIKVSQEQLGVWTERARQLTKTPQQVEEPTPLSKIEQDIASLSSGVLTKNDIQYSLQQKGYTQQEINQSSAGSFLNKVSDATSSFFSNLFSF